MNKRIKSIKQLIILSRSDPIKNFGKINRKIAYTKLINRAAPRSNRYPYVNILKKLKKLRSSLSNDRKKKQKRINKLKTQKKIIYEKRKPYLPKFIFSFKSIVSD